MGGGGEDQEAAEAWPAADPGPDSSTVVRPGFLDRFYAVMRRWGLSAVGNPVAAIALAGVVLFAPRLIAATTFYDALGASPGDVGLGFTDALGQAAVDTTAWLLGIAALFIVLVGLLTTRGALALARHGTEWAVLATLAWFSSIGSRGDAERHLAQKANAAMERPENPWAPRRDQARAALSARWRRLPHPFGGQRKRLRSYLVLLLVFAVLGLQVAIPFWALVAGNDAKDGTPTGPLRFLGATLLDVHAERVAVAPAAPASAVTTELQRAICLLYLGRDGETTALYDATRGETIRVPASLIIVSRTPNQGECRDGGTQKPKHNRPSGGGTGSTSNGTQTQQAGSATTSNGTSSTVQPAPAGTQTGPGPGSGTTTATTQTQTSPTVTQTTPSTTQSGPGVTDTTPTTSTSTATTTTTTTTTTATTPPGTTTSNTGPAPPPRPRKHTKHGRTLPPTT